MITTESRKQQKHVANFILDSSGGFRHYVLREHDQPDVVGFNEPERGIHWKAEVDTYLIKAVDDGAPDPLALRYLGALALLAVTRGYDLSYPLTSQRLSARLNQFNVHPISSV